MFLTELNLFNLFIIIYLKNSRKDTISFNCNHKLCVHANDILVMVPMLPPLNNLDGFSSQNYQDFKIEHRPEFSNLSPPQKSTPPNITLVFTNGKPFTPNLTTNHQTYFAFYTSDCSTSLNCISNVAKTFILKRVIISQRTKYNSKIVPSKVPLPDIVEKHLEWKYEYSNRVLIKLRDEAEFLEAVKETEDVLNIGSGIFYEVYRANIVWDLGDPWGQTIARERFADNNELKYSLRSLEKFAPWVRNIFLVTNGQVPDWLNINHPKIKLVTHDQIFPNKSHLPTFSSPAIEVNLHRIEGLSQRFLYFNDDIFLAKSTLKEDFLTKNNGFRFRMAWTAQNQKSPPCDEKEIFHCSVRFVNGLLDEAYGSRNRMIPAHAPHLLDRNIVQAMIDKFSKQFEKTSAARFRRTRDMQFTFTYYYYVLHEGKWLVELLKDYDVKFFMITGKSYMLKQYLKNFCSRPTKFLCLNDDLDYGRVEQTKRLIEVRDAFLNEFFSQKSKFEI